MPRCPGCNKFASYEGDEEPEVQDEPELDEDGNFSFTVRVVKRSACCSEELKETTLEFSGQVDPGWLAAQLEKTGDDGEALTVEDLEVEVTDLTQTEEGGGRYAKGYYGAECSVTVSAPDGDTWTENFSDKTAASHFDDLTY